MKKVFILFSVLLVIFCLVGCENTKEQANNQQEIKIEENISENTSNEIESQENVEENATQEQVKEDVEQNKTEENTAQETEKSEETKNNSEDNNVEQNKSEENVAQSQEEKDDSKNENKILVVFFSRADENYSVGTVEVGNTEIMAGFIKDYLGDKADTFKIDPVTPYPANYKECTEVATKELNDNARPEFKNANTLDMKNYDTVILGYPIWWGDVPMIINTFLEKYDFSGKTVYLFNTHEGSGNSGTYSSIKKKVSSANVNTNGLAIRGADAREETSRSTVENWLKGLGM